MVSTLVRLIYRRLNSVLGRGPAIEGIAKKWKETSETARRDDGREWFAMKDGLLRIQGNCGNLRRIINCLGGTTSHSGREFRYLVFVNSHELRWETPRKGGGEVIEG